MRPINALTRAEAVMISNHFSSLGPPDPDADLYDQVYALLKPYPTEQQRMFYLGQLMDTLVAEIHDRYGRGDDCLDALAHEVLTETTAVLTSWLRTALREDYRWEGDDALGPDARIDCSGSGRVPR